MSLNRLCCLRYLGRFCPTIGSLLLAFLTPHTTLTPLTILTLLALVPVSPAYANPTGAPLMTFPVPPCRVLDTRIALGPIPPNTAIDVFVRGNQLPATYGAKKADCGIPPSAEAAILNVVAINPSTSGVLIIDGTGGITATGYSRLNYNVAVTSANEMIVSLCNAALMPSPQTPCPWNGAGLYMDAQILNSGIGPVHALADVVGYLARPEE